MKLATGILLLVAGAILAFAVKDSIEAINLGVIGYVLMAAGVVGIVLTLVMDAQRGKTTHREVLETNPNGPNGAPGTQTRTSSTS